MAPLFVPVKLARSEIAVNHSRFICTVFPSASVIEAKAHINAARSEFSDASHHVPAYIIGHGSSVIEHCSDDGEPSGTAGKPVLSILKGSGYGDITVVVTRYFGGTKLGKGGLVRAYSEATRLALANTEKGIKKFVNCVNISLPYPIYQTINSLITNMGGEITKKTFSNLVELEVQIQVDDYQNLIKQLNDLSRGTVDSGVTATKYVTTPV